MNALHFLSGMHWLRPDAFLLLLVVLPLVALFWWGNFKLRQRARLAIGEEHLVSRFTEPLRMTAEVGFLVAWLTAMTLFVVAIAGPVMPDAPTTVSEGSLQIVILADVSRSIAARGISLRDASKGWYSGERCARSLRDAPRYRQDDYPKRDHAGYARQPDGHRYLHGERLGHVGHDHRLLLPA